MAWLRKIIGRLDGRKIIDSVFRIIFASFGSGLLAYASLALMDKLVPTEQVWGILSQGLVDGIVGILGFWLIGYLLKIEEMGIFLASLKRKLFRSARVMAEDNIGEGDGA
jgi:hypothetical protein